MDSYETVTQAAQRLGVSGSLVRRWARDEQLEAVKVGRDWLVKRNAEPEAVVRFRPPRGGEDGK